MHLDAVPPPPFNLRCEYLVNPVGLDVRRPRFSWTLRHPERGRLQSAYRIIVSSSLEMVGKFIGDVWDSGKVASDQSTNVEYGGGELESRRRYYWRVKWWDDTGRESPFSEIAFFETGILSQEEWRAKWIGGGRLLRREFMIDGEVRRARVYICGLGYYELRVNGVRVGDRVLDPPWTDYEKLALYTVYDVTDYVRKGNNAVAVMLGNGRYSPKHEWQIRNIQVKRYDDAQPKLSAEIHVWLDNGGEAVVVTDEEWRVSEGPVVYDDIYGGEVYDARLEEDGFDHPGYDDSGWRRAVVTSPPCRLLRSSTPSPPIRRIRQIPARRILNPSPGVYVYDFGQNFSGWVKLKVRGERGAEVRMKYAELVAEDGELNTAPNRAAKSTDVYILRGGCVEEYEPHFTYHGFRYVELTGYPGTPGLDTLTGVEIHSDVEPVGGFSCSDQLLNDIHRIILWSILSNLMGVPTDCPQRDERLGWMGDAHLVAESAILNFDMAAFYSKWLRDMRLAQAEDGSVPDVVPPIWLLYPADPAWGSACAIIPWLLYLYYGDRRALEENYDMMKRWIEYLSSRAENHIVRLSKYGDWCRPGFISSPETPGELVSTWFYYYSVKILAGAAKALGRIGDWKRYSALAEEIRAAFNREFLSEGRYGVVRPSSQTMPLSSQTSNILPLYLDLAPEAEVHRVFDNLLEDIVVRRDYHLATGIIGTRYLLETLSKYGYSDVAYRVVSQTSYPGWGYMIREGATTLWERWELLTGGGMNSHNHAMFGGIDSWFYKVLAGINPSAEEPGFKKIVIKPHIIEELKHVSASTYTQRGLISSAWHIVGGRLALEVSIPVNSTGIVWLPVREASRPVITEGGRVIWREENPVPGVEGVKSVWREGDHVVVEVGSGNYSFQISTNASED